MSYFFIKHGLSEENFIDGFNFSVNSLSILLIDCIDDLMGVLLICTIELIQKWVQDHSDKFGVLAVSLKLFLASTAFLVLFSSLSFQTYGLLVELVIAFVRHLEV